MQKLDEEITRGLVKILNQVLENHPFLKEQFGLPEIHIKHTDDIWTFHNNSYLSWDTKSEISSIQILFQNNKERIVVISNKPAQLNMSLERTEELSPAIKDIRFVLENFQRVFIDKEHLNKG